MKLSPLSNNTLNAPVSDRVLGKEAFLAANQGYAAQVAEVTAQHEAIKLGDWDSKFTGHKISESVQYFPVGEYTKADGTKNSVPVLVIFPFFADNGASPSQNSWSVNGLVDVMLDTYQSLEIGRHIEYYDPTSHSRDRIMALMVDPDPKYGNRNWLSYDWANFSMKPHGWADNEDGRQKYAAYAARHNTINMVLASFWRGERIVVGLVNEIQNSRVLRTLIGREDMTVAEYRTARFDDAAHANAYRQAQSSQSTTAVVPLNFTVGALKLDEAVAPFVVIQESKIGKPMELHLDPKAPDYGARVKAMELLTSKGYTYTLKS